MKKNLIGFILCAALPFSALANSDDYSDMETIQDDYAIGDYDNYVEGVYINNNRVRVSIKGSANMPGCNTSEKNFAQFYDMAKSALILKKKLRGNVNVDCEASIYSD